jgi:hypothetical protein
VPARPAARSAAARCACAAAIGGFAVDLLFAGFSTLEIQHSGDAPLGPADDLAGVSIALLIPAAPTLTGFLPARRTAPVIQAARMFRRRVTRVGAAQRAAQRAAPAGRPAARITRARPPATS